MGYTLHYIGGPVIPDLHSETVTFNHFKFGHWLRPKWKLI